MLLVLAAAFFLIVTTWLCRTSEARAFNRGVCRCGSRWRRFDVDSQGGRGYRCDACGDYCWVSYGVDGDYEE
ncbi:hypothetical protein Rctr197k_276 [Virus Rctr197k]|nr:hypothetical protein Rctr197k_276 [Virus Rctr197k]